MCPERGRKSHPFPFLLHSKENGEKWPVLSTPPKHFEKLKSSLLTDHPSHVLGLIQTVLRSEYEMAAGGGKRKKNTVILKTVGLLPPPPLVLASFRSG